jgi:AcrR family transcriptional regulator
MMTEFPTQPPPPEDELSKGERTRQEILQAALKLFTSQGYHGTSMRQIKEQAGVALGSIYNHFKSKEEIFEAVTRIYHPIHSILPTLEHSQGETVEEGVRQSAEQMFDTLTQREDYLNLMFIEAVEFKGQHLPGLFAEMFPRALNFATQLRQKRGSLRPGTPLPVMVATFIGLMFAFFIFQRVFAGLNEQDDPKQTMQQVIDIFLHGILQQETEK